MDKKELKKTLNILEEISDLSDQECEKLEADYKAKEIGYTVHNGTITFYFGEEEKENRVLF